VIRGAFNKLLQGHPEAVDLCVAVFKWANDYDHLIDGDPLGRPQDVVIHDVMWFLAVVLPQNSFYRRHQAELTVSLANAITTWRASCVLQGNREAHSIMLAHVLRWTLIEFFLHCARLVAGKEWADTQGPAFWLLMTQDHSLAEFTAENKGD
jgi:hypothetical protein